MTASPVALGEGPELWDPEVHLAIWARNRIEDTTLRFRVLGSLRVEIGLRSVDLGGPKQRAVLALLLVNANEPVSAERMIHELWGERPPASALGTLQAYVSNLRRVLEPDRAPRAPSTVLRSSNGAYELFATEANSDLLLFEHLCRSAGELLITSPTKAHELIVRGLELWRGPALCDFAMYDFAVAEAARLEELRIGAIEDRISAELAWAAPASLVAELEQLVAAHPFRERLWHHLMRAYYLADRQAEALRAFRRCERMLTDELGISPSPALRSLEQAILQQDPALEPTAAADERAEISMGRRTPGIIGRSAELGRFDELLEAASTGVGSLLLVSGEAGVGKSRLLDAMGERAAARNSQIAVARCVEVGGTPPFWPLVQLLRSLHVDEVLTASGVRATGDPSTETSARHRIADGIVDVVRNLTERFPMVLLIDDLSSADPDSLSVLTLITAQLRHLKLVIVGTFRSAGLPNDHPLPSVLGSLAASDRVHRLLLGRLDAEETQELVRTVVGESLSEETVRSIHDRSEGNAFFTTELARLAKRFVDLGAPPPNPAIPLNVRDVVDRRIKDLDPSGVRLIRAAAVIGREFDLVVAAAVADIPLDQALDVADAAVDSGLLHELGPPGRFRFSHLLVVETVVGGISALRRAQLHDRIADEMEARVSAEPTMDGLSTSDPQRLDEIAHHRIDAMPVAGIQPAIAALARAGRHAAGISAFELSDRHLERRHQLVMSQRPSPARDAAELDSLLDQALLWTWRDGYQSQLMNAATERLFQLIGATDIRAMLDPETRTGTRHGVLASLQVRSSYEIVAGEIVAARAVAESMLALAEVNPHPEVVAVAAVNAMVVAIHEGSFDEAVRHAEVANEMLTEVDPRLTGVTTLPVGQQSLAVTTKFFAGWAHWAVGNSGEARRLLAEGRVIADRCGHAFSRTFQTSIECIVGVCDDNPDWVADALAWGRQDVAGIFGFLDAVVGLYRSWVCGMGGDPRRGSQEIRDAIARLDADGARVVRTLHWGMVAQLELRAADPAKALEASDRGIEHAESFGERFWRPELDRLRSRSLELLGQSS